MGLHYLLANVAFAASLAHILIGVVLVHIRVATGHLFHLHVNWFLAVDLRDETVHALGQTLGNRKRHVRDDVDDLLLPLERLVIRLDHVQVVVVDHLVLQQMQVLLLPEALARLPLLRLVYRVLHFKLQLSTLFEGVIPTERVHRELGLVSALVLVHLKAYPLAQLHPLVLLLQVLGLHVVDVFLLHLVFLVKHLELSLQLYNFSLSLRDDLLELVLLLLELHDSRLKFFLLVVELFFQIENLDVNHFVLLNLSDQLLLSQLQILVDLLQLLLHLRDLMRVVSREEAGSKVAARRLLARLVLLPLVFQLLKHLNSLG